MTKTPLAVAFAATCCLLIAVSTVAQSSYLTEEARAAHVARMRAEFRASPRVPVLMWAHKHANAKTIADQTPGFEIKFDYDRCNGVAGTLDEASYEAWLHDPRIDFVAFDDVTRTQLLESRVTVQADQVESVLGLTGAGITVACLDTGIDYTNPHQGLFHGGYDYINNDADPMDDTSQAHGSVVAGVIASQHPTHRGLAPGAGLCALKVSNFQEGGNMSVCAAALNWILTNRETFNIRVVNMSIGIGSDYTPATNPAVFDPAIQACYDAGITLVAASGNSGIITGMLYPAISPWVISVGATYDAPFATGQGGEFGCNDAPPISVDQVTCWCTRPPFTTMLAPGARITSTGLASHPMITRVGTSFASPHVAATAALMLERNPNLTPAQIKEILVATGVPVFDSLSGVTFPRLNALAAVEAVPRLTHTGALAGDTLVTFHIDAPLAPSSFYALGLSAGSSVGIPFPDGRVLGLDWDWLLDLSVLTPAAISLSDSQGVLDANGHAEATLWIPDIPGFPYDLVDIYSASLVVPAGPQPLILSNVDAL